MLATERTSSSSELPPSSVLSPAWLASSKAADGVVIVAVEELLRDPTVVDVESARACRFTAGSQISYINKSSCRDKADEIFSYRLWKGVQR